MVLTQLIIGRLRARPGRSLITLAGIAIGVAVMISLISLGQGMREAVALQFSGLGTDRIIIQAKAAVFGPPGIGVVKPLTDKDFDQLSKVAGVGRTAKRIVKQGNMQYNNNVQYVFVGSMPTLDEGRRFVEETFRLKTITGRLLRQGDTTAIVLGNHYLAVDHFGKPIRVGTNVLIQNKTFKVVGILNKLGQPQFDSIIFMPENAMRDLYKTGDELSVLVAQAQPGITPEKVADNIRKDLRRYRNQEEGKEDFTVETQGQLLGTLDDVLSIVTGVLAAIALIAALVGGVNIMNALYTSVLERTREIGVMKAVGARNIDIALMFMAEAGFLGMIGGLLGLVIGIGFAKAVEYIAFLALGTALIHAQISITLILSALGFGLLTGVLAGLLPAVRASKLSPAEAVRYE